VANILVVDDDEGLAATVSFILKKKGYQVQEIDDGAKVLERLGVKPARSGVSIPDLILLDLDLPVIDGYTIIRHLYDNTPTRSIPVVIMSGRGQRIELSEMSPNVKAYIEKPVQLEYLLAVIGEALQQKPV